MKVKEIIKITSRMGLTSAIFSIITMFIFTVIGKEFTSFLWWWFAISFVMYMSDAPIKWNEQLNHKSERANDK